MMPLPAPRGDLPTLLREDEEAILLADRLGFDEAWVGEHLTAATEPIASPLIFLASLIAKTGKIRLGTGVLALPHHHPAVVAGHFALFDHLSPGRPAGLARRPQHPGDRYRCPGARLSGASRQRHPVLLPLSLRPALRRRPVTRLQDRPDVARRRAHRRLPAGEHGDCRQPGDGGAAAEPAAPRPRPVRYASGRRA